MEEEIDIERLIALVSLFPVIWDKTIPDYHSRVLTIDAWKNVCTELNPQFKEMSAKERNVYGKTVMKKWRNIRDQWAKACKKVADQQRSGTPAKAVRYYVYHEQLSFLNKTVTLNETESSFDAGTTESPDTPSESDSNDLENDDIRESVELRHRQQTTKSQKEPIVKKRKVDLEALILQTLEDNDHKLYFFKSILPSVKDFTDDEVLELQSGVIHLVQTIKRNRIFQPQQPGNTAYMPDSSTHTFMQNTRPITSPLQPPVSPKQPYVQSPAQSDTYILGK